MEKIISSAIRLNAKAVFVGKRHPEIYELIHDANIRVNDQVVEEGFLTDEERFVNRQEAAKIALAARQITDKRIVTLYSEDIWPDDEELCYR